MHVGQVQRRSFRHHNFTGAQARKFGMKIGGAACHRLEPAGRNIGSGDPDLAVSAHLRQRDEHIVAPGIKQRLLGQRAGRHVSHDVARHERLAPARLRLRRGFGLLGDGDAMARLDQPREIALRAVDRHPAHRDRRAIMFAPTGQRDVERGRRRLGIIEEEFEEIAHAVEEQAILRLGLERQILRHHGRKGWGRVRGAAHPARIAARRRAGKSAKKRPSRTCPQAWLAARAKATDRRGG